MILLFTMFRHSGTFKFRVVGLNFFVLFLRRKLERVEY